MSCDRFAPLIMPFADRELGRLQAMRVSRHLAHCERCSADHRAFVGLASQVRREVPRHRAPSDLVDPLRARFASGAPPRSPTSQRWRWGAAGAVAGSALTILVWIAATAVLDRHAGDDLANRLVAAHVRAVASEELVAVASSDRHRVKPWLSARLDYSPPVQDLASEGFPLVGGRIDVVDDRRVAALVYRYRDHVVDVFVRPAASGSMESTSRTIRGFNVVSMRGGAMDWIAVSDANAPTVAHLLRRLSQPPDGPP